MKTNPFLSFSLCMAFALALSCTSCKKKTKDEVEPDPDLTTERDLSNSDNDLNSLMSDIDRALDNGASANLREESTYATVMRKDSNITHEGVFYTKYMTITYSGVAAADGQTRNGVARVHYTGTRQTGDFKSYTIFSGTKVGGRSISGVKYVKQVSSNDSNTWRFDISASGTVTTVDGRIINYTSTRTRIRAGITTLGNLTDDSFTVTGTWSGTNADGESVTGTIVSPLQLTYGCRYFREITSGKINFTNSNKGITRSIDYGSGTCDGKGVFTNAKGRSFVFYFKR